MDDDFDVDADLIDALAASEAGNPQPSRPPIATTSGAKPTQPSPQKFQQPKPQRLDRPSPASSTNAPKVVQPTPQALPTRSSGSSILVSPRQKGNPVLACLRSIPWEYSDIPADYGLGLTTCALFLSLKYHRLHPEYIYTRIRNLQGKYNLRILLTLVDIPNHEDSLRELSKASLVNNVTIILCWSAAEAARYLELYKSYEHANFTAIKGQQPTTYAEKLVEFVTVPRRINKADAVALVSTFGSLRNAINADPEQIAAVSGWGERKVKSWCRAVGEPFRIRMAARRRANERARDADSTTAAARSVLEDAIPLSRVPLRDMPGRTTPQNAGAARGSPTSGHDLGQTQASANAPSVDIDIDDEDAMIAAAIEASKKDMQLANTSSPAARLGQEDKLSDGIASALAKLRDNK
ncbi:hypothetical protein VTK73DRAFT_1114 [Phialemonium thermophilum]|uniref:ERCC1-like central domain-containing protein n=1 Tax=Phialemonium thermophilum TaxID=223376 RepID=A0ABR3XBV9_9PEZI